MAKCCRQVQEVEDREVEFGSAKVSIKFLTLYFPTAPVSSCYEMRKESLVLCTSWIEHSLAYSDGVKFVF